MTFHSYTIKNFGLFNTASQDGRVGFISIKDIAQAAVDALTKSDSLDGDVYIVGPELLSNDDVCRELLFRWHRDLTNLDI